MSPATGPITEIGACIERHAGQETKDKVMAGSETIRESTKPPKVAEWAKGAMERLDEAVDVPTRNAIMTECGYNCFERAGKKSALKSRARRNKYASEDEFLEAEQRNPPVGTRLEREGNVLYQFYTPRAYTHPMRCYCSLMRGLPEGETASLTYCQCSRGLVEKTWEIILGRPVQVEVLASAIAGAEECKFAIHL